MTGEAKPEPKKKYSVHNPYKSVYAKSVKDGKSDFSPETVRDIQHPGFLRAEQNDLIDDCIAYVMDHPEKYFETKDALRGGLAERLEWELGHDNIGWLDETFKPWLESEKKKLKDQIPPPKKNQSTSMELNGEKITFRNERNAGTDAK